MIRKSRNAPPTGCAPASAGHELHRRSLVDWTMKHNMFNGLFLCVTLTRFKLLAL